MSSDSDSEEIRVPKRTRRDQEFEDIEDFLNDLSDMERSWKVQNTSEIPSVEDVWKMLNEKFQLQDLRGDEVMAIVNADKEKAHSLYQSSISTHASQGDVMDELYTYHSESGLEDGLEDYDHSLVIKRVTRLLKVVDTGRRVVENTMLLQHSIVTAERYPGKDIKDVFSNIMYDTCNLGGESETKGEESLRDHQELLIYLLNQICVYQYRRVEDGMYVQIYHNNHATHAWKHASTIRDFIQSSCQKETRGEFWRKLTSKLNVAAGIEDHLIKCHDCQFPDLGVDRHVFSFTNGVFICNNKDAAGKYAPKFHSYANGDIPHNVVSSKFHEVLFPEELCKVYAEDDKSFMEIPTPELTDMLDFQKLSVDMQLWLFVFIGRMMWNVKEGDDWQIMPFLKGVAGSGKSTIIYDVINRFYCAEDVFMVGNNCERKFGLQNCMKMNGSLKLICLMPEVKQDFGMEQGDWQQCVSGERISVNRKHRNTSTVTFDMPIFAAGNQMIGYDDNSNSVARRVPVIKFNIPVGARQDGDKPKKLHAELPHILLKSALAYAWASNNHGRKNVWNVLPDEFKEEKKLLVESQHPLVNYMASGKLVFDVNLYCPQKLFVVHFKQHVQDNCLSKFKWNSDFYETAFAESNIVIERNKTKLYDNKAATGTFLMGVDILDSDTTPMQRQLAADM